VLISGLADILQTQEKSLYPKLLSLLRPYSSPSSANILGWHAEGPYLQLAKRGAHAPPFLLTAPNGYKSFEQLYGAENLADAEDWLMNQGTSTGEGEEIGVRIITAAPEVEGVMDSISELTKRGVVFSIGHR
jgi:N-acetylglucosamine-6-phosphate deacetylase